MTADELAAIIKDLRKGQRRARRRAKLKSIWAVIWPRLEVLRLRGLLHTVVAQKDLLHKEIMALRDELEKKTRERHDDG